MARAAKTRCAGTWTESKRLSFIRSALRRAFTRYPSNYIARNKARRPYEGTNRNQKWEYLCTHCNKWYIAKNTQLDHTVPAGSITCDEDIGGFVSRLFCEPNDLSLLCKPCHQIKTNQERENRKHENIPTVKNTKRTRAKRNLSK
jgi:5-methylcytosine-specific restriction endonuclease McrA